MFNIIHTISGTIISACSDLDTAKSILEMIDTAPSTYEIVEVYVESAE